eukprot:2414051-Pleurochrysis_carterae.AAC.1
MEACDAQDACRRSDDAYIGDRGGWRGTPDVRAPDQRLLHRSPEGHEDVCTLHVDDWLQTKRTVRGRFREDSTVTK